MPMFAQMVSGKYMCVKKTDGSVDRYDIAKVKEVYYGYFVDCPVSGKVDGYGYVDLGLPSGLKWATMNVGAVDGKDYGGTCFAWGEIAPAFDNDYADINCKAYGKYDSQLREQGVIDAKGKLTAKYDAATQNWSKNWRMPTDAEFDELIKNCIWTWTSFGDVNGYKVASKVNNNWIFLPAAGHRYGNNNYNVGSKGYYLSSTIYKYDTYNAYCLYLDSSSKNVNSSDRRTGRNIRPVTE